MAHFPGLLVGLASLALFPAKSDEDSLWTNAAIQKLKCGPTKLWAKTTFHFVKEIERLNPSSLLGELLDQTWKHV